MKHSEMVNIIRGLMEISEEHPELHKHTDAIIGKINQGDMKVSNKPLKKLHRNNKHKFFDDVKIGGLYEYSTGYEPKTVEKLANEHGYTTEYTNEVYGCLGFRVTGRLETGQRQDSLYDQLKTVRQKANEIGCYDAADFIRDHLERVEKKTSDVTLPNADQVIRYLEFHTCFHLEGIDYFGVHSFRDTGSPRRTELREGSSEDEVKVVIETIAAAQKKTTLEVINDIHHKER